MTANCAQTELRFTKMHGAGNDFVMINAYERPFSLNRDQIRFLCDRRLGVGCDQLLVVEKSALPGVDFRYRIFNQDGGEVEMCGNGARCFAVFVRQEGLTDKRTIQCETMCGIIAPTVEDDGRVTVDMGAPEFAPERVGFVTQNLSHLTRAHDTIWQVRAAGGDHWLSVVSMGNPHAVKVVGDVDTADVEALGTALQSHPAFPQRVNVGFLQVIDPEHARLRVFERGVGETLACGTGACAAAVAGMRRGALHSTVHIAMRGGTLTIAWDGAQSQEPKSVKLTGPAQTVFTGSVRL